MADYQSFLSMFGSLNLGNQTGNPSSSSNINNEASSSTSNVDAQNYPARCRYLPFTSPPPPTMFSPANYPPKRDLVPLQRRINSIITTSEGSNRLARTVENLKRNGLFIEITDILLALSMDPSSLLRYACDKNGSLAIQKIVGTVKNSCFAMLCLTNAIALVLPRVASDPSGRHVITDCFKELDFEYNKPLSVQMIRHCVTISTAEYGCICLNDCLPLMEITYKNKLLESIVIDCQYLAQDYYGTFVVQNVIVRKDKFYSHEIVNRLRGMILRLAMQQKGSHLVEKCFGMSSTKQIVLEELLRLNSNQMLRFASHEFGNFVIQRALSSTLDEDSPKVQYLTRELRRALSRIVGDLRQHSIGKNVYKKYKETHGYRGGLGTSSAVYDFNYPLIDC